MILKGFFVIFMSMLFVNEGNGVIAGWENDIANFPHMLSMRRTTIHICGASIIAAQWTVTSAKCLVGVPAFQVSFRAGSSSRIAGGTIYQANLIVLHPDFKVDSFEFDVALVRISRQFQGPNIQIIALADESVSIRDRAKAKFAGWGVTNSGGFILPNILQAIEVPIIGAHECTCMMNTMTDVTDNMICAGAGVLDKCIGDFGGGLVIDNKLIGVASFSRNCGDSRFPGLYARVSSSIIKSFIRSVTGI